MPRTYLDRKEYFDTRRQACMDFLRDYKKDKSCVKCGWNKHPEILHFHHRNPADKRFGFSKGSIGNYSLDVILAEIQKCDLLCPNCHGWVHFQEDAKLSK